MNLIEIVKKNHSLCSKCSSWTHETKKCNFKSTCNDCKGEHLQELCTIQKLFTCSVMKSGGSLMCLQDVSFNSQNNIACCLLNNGSEATLVKDTLQERMDFPMKKLATLLVGWEEDQ